MRKVIIREPKKIFPFNEPARDLRVMNKPLWLYQHDVLAPYCDEEIEVNSFFEIPTDRRETLVYRENLFFDRYFFEAFITEARKRNRPSRVAFSPDDKAITNYALLLQKGIHRQGNLYVADMWYFPRGVKIEEAEPLVIDTEAREIGFYHVPTYMAPPPGDLVYYIPLRAFLSIEHWIHIYFANVAFGIFAEGARMEKEAEKLSVKLKILSRSILERKQFLSCSELVKVGKNTQIDPTAIIQGPTYIGDNCTIGAGAVISNCLIGNNVNIMQGCQLLLSVVSDGCYLPFRASLFMSVLMENSMVAQNAVLQLCVVGRDSFVGAGTIFTDFNLIPKPVHVWGENGPESTGLPVLGCCIGHNCRIGSGLVFYPGRAVESDVILVRSENRSVITRNVYYEDSDHHKIKGGYKHQRLYPR